MLPFSCLGGGCAQGVPTSDARFGKWIRSCGDDFSAPPYDLIHRKSSLVARISREGIRAGIADATLSERFDCEVGPLILERRWAAEDSGGQQLEFNLNYYRGDRFTYPVNIERNRD